MKKIWILSTVIVVLLTGCGKVATTPEESSKRTISNYENKKDATEFKKVDRVYSQVPKQVFVNTKPAAELLLQLGLGDKIAGVGADFGSGDPSVAEEYRRLNKVSTEYVGKELALSVAPDLIFGRAQLFSEEAWGNGSVESLNEMGLPSFTLGSSVEGGTFASVYDDIERTGKLFQVEDKATAFSQKLKGKEQGIREKIGTRPAADFAYLHMSTPEDIMVYSADKETFFASIFEMVNLKNVFQDVHGEVSLETLIKANPEYLIVPDWRDDKGNGVSGQSIIEALYKDNRLQDMQAIKNKKVYSVDYNVMFGYGYQSLEGIEALAFELTK